MSDMTPRDVPEVESVWPVYCSTCDDKGFVRDEDNGGLCLDCDWRRNGYRVQRAFLKMEEQRDSALSTIAEMRAMVERYASECGECGGTGVRPSVWNDQDRHWRHDVKCEDCADIRALLSRLPVASPASTSTTEAKP